MFREVPVPAPPSSLRWKAITICTGASASTLQDIKVPESCGGYAYVDSGTTNANTRNRFIYWRTYQDVLELVEESLDMSLTGNMVRYKFQDTPVLPDITVHEAYGFVIILIATVASVHRLVFPHPARLHRQLFPQQSLLLSELSGPSIFCDASLPDEPNNQHLLAPGGSISSQFLHGTSALSHTGEAVYTLATTTGGVLLVKMPPLGVAGAVIQQELSCASLMNKLWTGLMPGSMRGGQLVSHTVLSTELVNLQGELYIFTICRDMHLRVWDTLSKQCILTENLLQYTSDSQQALTNALAGHRIKCVQGKTSQDLCVYLALQNKAKFVTLSPVVLGMGHIQMQCNSTVERAAMDDLVDYAVTEDCLMTLWASPEGDSLIYSVDMSGHAKVGASRWVPVHLSQLAEVTVPQHRDARDVYLERIFEPGVFSPQDIIKALSVYRRAPVPSMEFETLTNMDTLRNEVSNTIHAEMQSQAQEGELQEEDYTQLQLQQWEKFYSCCCQYKQVGEKAKGLFADPSTGLFSVIKKSTLSFVRPCDQTEELYLSPAVKIPPNVLERMGLTGEGYPSPEQLSEDLSLLCHCVRLIAESVPADYAHLFTSCLQSHIPPEQLLTLLGELIPREVAHNVASTVSGMANPVVAIETMLSFLEMSDPMAELDPMEGPDGDDSHLSRLFTGSLGVSLLASSLHQLVTLRLDCVRDLSLLLALLLHREQEVGLNQSQQATLREELTPKSHEMLRCYKVLVWAAQALTASNPNSTLDYNLRKLSSLEITDQGSSRGMAKPVSSSSPLMSVFIEGVGGELARQRLAVYQAGGPQGVERPGSLWRRDLPQLLHALCLLIWPATDDTVFPEFLVRACQYLRLQEFVQLTSPWCTWNEASRAFFLGLAHLHFNEPHKALRLFVEATDGVAETFLSQRLLRTEETDHGRLQMLYFLKIIKQFEEHGLPDLVLTLATSAINNADPVDPNLPSLQSKVFKQHLELGHNAEAFMAMSNNPDMERRKDCLRQFLVVLCERGDLDALVHFDYKDLEEEVVHILENRARSVDLFTHDYYSLLYAFFITRDDYRKAGRVMFERGLRLSMEVPGPHSLQQQAMCYLAATNALRLVQPDNAWIVKPVFPSPQREAGRPKHGLDGHHKADPKGQKKMEILELKDLELEYLLLSARLRLIQYQPECPLVSGPMPAPEELLSLLCTSGLYDLALCLTQRFELPPDTLLASLSLRCITLATLPKAAAQDPSTSAWRWLKENAVPPCGAQDSPTPAHQAWSLLQSYLGRLEDGSGTCHKCVAHTLLSHSFHLPTWLILSFKTVDVASLLRVYLTYDLLSQATALAVEYLEGVINVLDGLDSPAFNLKGLNQPSPMKVWVPYTCLDQLLAALRDQESATFSNMYESVKDTLQHYQIKADEVTQAIRAH